MRTSGIPSPQWQSTFHGFLHPVDFHGSSLSTPPCTQAVAQETQQPTADSSSVPIAPARPQFQLVHLHPRDIPQRRRPREFVLAQYHRTVPQQTRIRPPFSPPCKAPLRQTRAVPRSGQNGGSLHRCIHPARWHAIPCAPEARFVRLSAGS